MQSQTHPYDSNLLHCLGQGDDGSAYLLEDGRVLRRTISKREIAIAIQLKDAQEKGMPIPGLPKIDDIFWMTEHITIGNCVREVKQDFIIREEMSDIDVDIQSKNPTTWNGSVKCFNLGWTHDNQEYLDAAITEQPILKNILETLLIVRERFGITIVDLGRTSNFGMLGTQIGIRDFSRAKIPEDLLLIAEKREFKEVKIGKKRTLFSP